MITFNVLFGGFFVLLLLFLWTRRRFYYLAWQLGGPLGYPLLGMAHKLLNLEDVLNILWENKKIYGRSFVAWLGPTPVLIVTEPRVIQTILTSPDCLNKSILYDAFTDGTGIGLINSNSPDWESHRKMLNPTFSYKVILSLVPIFNREADSLQAELNELVDFGGVDLRYILQKRTLNIASQTTMGQVKNSTDQNKELLDAYKCVLETTTRMTCSPWLNYKIVLKMTDLYRPYTESKNKIRSFIKKQAKQMLSQRENELHKDDFLETQDEFGTTKNSKIFIDGAIDLFKNGKLTWRDVENESNHIVFGAFETTSNTIGYVLILLSMFPKYQDRLYEEIQSVIKSKDSNIDVTYEEIKQFTYMDMVLNETMRIMAPVLLVGRQVMKDVTLPDGIVLPQGMQVLIDIYNMHRDPELWGPESTTFNPDNFLPANMEGKHPYAFIPFNKGLRNCIGWRYALISMKIVLSKLLRKYRFTTKFDFQDLHFVEEITIKLKKYPLLEIHLRES